MRFLTILDGGHGLETQGKRTPIFPDGTLLKENEFNDDVVMRVYNKLNKVESMDVAFTAEENYDVPLNTRVIRANRAWAEHQEQFGKENSKCILISVHANAYGNGTTFNTAKGIETYCCPTPPSERVLAETIHKHLKGGTTQVDRGVQEICFAILKGNMTSCLVECAFMTNLDEANLLKQEAFRQECADEIVAGILEYFGINQPQKEADEVRYKEYSERIHENRGSVEKFKVGVLNESNRKITKAFCTNGIFQWWYDAARTKAYPTSILIINGKIIQNVANHYYDFGTPQSVFIVYKNGKVDMKRVNFATDLDYKNIAYGLGVVGLRNTLDPDFKYSPTSEGFKAGYRKQDGKWVDYTDVLRDTTKVVVGYNIKLDKMYLLVVKSATHAELLKIISDNSTGEAYDIAGSVDGGGSGLLRANGEDIVSGDGRIICTILYFD